MRPAVCGVEKRGKIVMIHSEHSQSNAFQNPIQQNPQLLQSIAQALAQQSQNPQGFGAVGQGQGGVGQGGLGQGAYGQGVYGQGGFGQGGFGQGGSGQQGWGQQRQLSQQDVSAILQQIAPVLPQLIAQAQQGQVQPLAAFGGGFGQQRTLSPQDVNEIVRQILPVILQSTQQNSLGGQQGWSGGAGLGAYGNANAQQQSPFQQTGWQQQQRGGQQVTQQDVQEIVRQVSEALSGGQAGQSGQQRLF